MAAASVSGYDPGMADTDSIRLLAPNQWAIDSFRGNGSYIVTLGDQPSCNCPQWVNRCAGSDRQCKHQVAVIEHTLRQQRADAYHELEMKAGSVDDELLEKLIAKYITQPGPILVALLGEKADREALEAVEEAAEAPILPALETVLERARSYGRSLLVANAGRRKLPSQMTNAERLAIWQ